MQPFDLSKRLSRRGTVVPELVFVSIPSAGMIPCAAYQFFHHVPDSAAHRSGSWLLHLLFGTFFVLGLKLPMDVLAGRTVQSTSAGISWSTLRGRQLIAWEEIERFVITPYVILFRANGRAYGLLHCFAEISEVLDAIAPYCPNPLVSAV